MNNDQKIKLMYNGKIDYITFNLKGEFIKYKRMFKLPEEDFEFISILKYNKLYLCSNNYIYE